MIAVSIVSHGHGKMVSNLVSQLLLFNEITSIIVTLNIREDISEYPKNPIIKYIYNQYPKGFGSNHNAAFKLVKDQYFCILNPDVELFENPYPSLVNCFNLSNVGLSAPLVLSKSGIVEDSMRYFPTLKLLFRKLLFGYKGTYNISKKHSIIYPNWVAGMFMLFSSKIYGHIGGFDESYFMYYEDVDICERIWLSGYRIAGDARCFVIHDARRASRKNLIHMRWHLRSMVIYLWRYK